MDDGDQLCEAARNGDGGKVKALIDSGADVSHFDGEGLTPLLHAAKHGHVVVIKMLLEAVAPLNALSPSNLSAGDFAMDAGHLRYPPQLGKDEKVGDCNGDYLEDRFSYSEYKLMDAESKAVLMAWEKPLMEAHAKAVCSGGGHIVNIGFGMGLVDTAIQQYAPASHTIVEAQPVVYERMIWTGWAEKKNVKIIFGRWQDVLLQLESYDGVFFTCGEYYEDLKEFHQHLPALLKPDGIYFFFNGLCGEYNRALKLKIILMQ